MRALKVVVSSLVAALIGGAALAPAPSPLEPVAPAASEPGLAPLAPTPPPGGAALTRPDVEAWLDGFMPFALARSDIAGGVVVVVKDGEVLLQKGYGYADVARRKPVSAETTLFRPGSVSKLFTWTAVMQQVEAGKLDLDRDVNAYLDFTIPPFEGKPITLRNIMTHTAGFEETARHLISDDPKDLMPLSEFVRASLPRRLFAPGTTPAYSNYATALAGYIVARSSGMSFDDYVDSRILQPIGMTRSTFRQPLPPALETNMSRGYEVASGEAQPYEIVIPAPAGSLAATGADMGRFMIAHLEDGRGLLQPQTAGVMHNTTLTVLPPLNRMALGFYEQTLNGRRTIGHGGDTSYFHSDLFLLPAENVGVYVSVNSGGSEGAAGALRTALFQQFGDRYYPAPRQVRGIDAATAKRHAALMAGSYVNTRGAHTNFLSILELFGGQPKMGVKEDGSLAAASVYGLANQPRRWVETAPFVWTDPENGDRIAATVSDGKVVRWSFDAVSPFMMFNRVPWHRDSSWLMPATLAALAIVLLTALAWPVRAFTRRRYKANLPHEGRALNAYRLTHGFAWLTLLVLAGWATFVLLGMTNLPLLGGPLDPLLWMLQILSPIALFGLVGLALWNLWLAFSGKRAWTSRLWSVLLLLAAVILLWVGLAFHLIGFGMQY